MTRSSPVRNRLHHLAAASRAPKLDLRWLAILRPDGHGEVFCCEPRQVSDWCKLLTKRGCKVVGVFKTSGEASEALKPAPTQEEQAEVLVGGLAASLVLCKREVA